MTERKNIDRLFQEKFRDFEVTPDEQIWENIEAELTKKKKRRVIPFWFRMAGVAAALLIGLLLVDRWTSGTNKIENKVVGTEIPVNIENGQSAQPQGQRPSKEVDSVVFENRGTAVTDNDAVENAEVPSAPSQSDGASTAIKKNTVASGEKGKKEKTTSNKNKDIRIDPATALAGAKDAEDNDSKNGPEKQNNKSQVDNTIIPAANSVTVNDQENKTSKQDVDNPPVDVEKILNDLKGEIVPDKNKDGIADAETKKDSTAIATVEPNALEELLHEKEKKVTTTEQKVDRWQITSNVAPIYFSSTSNGSPLDSRFEDNKKNYTPSFSYGVGAKYAVNKKLSVKTGVNSVALEYNTTDLVFFQTDNARKVENLKPNIRGEMIQIDNKPDAVLSTLGRTITQYNGEINQKIGYIEVPVEMSYKLLDKKFGIEVIGGLSTMILNENEVSIVSPGLDMTIGEADNLNSVHFSTNVGVGFKYTFLKAFQANLEPMFKYQINTFSDDAGNFKPYFFGLYTGISYRF